MEKPIYPLMTLYLKNYVLRDSCYDCQYKGSYNIADIILGDFWGIEVTNPDMLDQKGVSALIINSVKGEEFIKKNNILAQTQYAEMPMSDLLKYNPAINESVEKPIVRKKVLCDLKYSIRLTSNYYNAMKENEKLISENKNLLVENTSLATQLNSIINSKRWKLMDKGINRINKLLRRK